MSATGFTQAPLPSFCETPELDLFGDKITEKLTRKQLTKLILFAKPVLSTPVLPGSDGFYSKPRPYSVVKDGPDSTWILNE